MILQDFFEENTACSLKNPISLMFHLGVLVFLLVGWANVGTLNGDEISRIHLSPTQTPCFMVVPWCFHTFHTFEGEPTTCDNMKGFLSTGRTNKRASL